MRAATTIVGLAVAILLTSAAPAAADILPVGTWPFNEGKGTVTISAGYQLSRPLPTSFPFDLIL